ncbi:MAG: hypothetical protein A2604_00100 [Candidatus Liptonbacteria bacterium RIFOXYD1_FULL_36_11]|uniref:Uncharacterized protein n=1 Tax=Candidatus Liptonbacteria bacterium RIFOXYD1_FULL_36_11 TaxID=1798656 RepID=A0A1G2CP03_9BACT|nr:MAG: hypothetical protein A2604_00100 [Candidatus Liptonbacteria bacterium RIFOXYD1_FULL_36_11]
MLELILYLVLMTSVAVVAVVFSRGIPRVEDEKEEGFYARLDKWVASLPFSKADIFLKNSSHKVLRKLRVSLMKVDNFLDDFLERTKETNGANGKIKIEDFVGKSGENKEGEKKD